MMMELYKTDLYARWLDSLATSTKFVGRYYD